MCSRIKISSKIRNFLRKHAYLCLEILDITACGQILQGLFDSTYKKIHLSNPLPALQQTFAMAREHVLLDTEVYPSTDSVIKLRWEEPDYIRSAARSGIVVIPSKSAVELMFKELAVSGWCEIPVQHDMPRDYRELRRTSWLIKV